LNTILTIPAEVTPDVREGLFCLLGGAAEAIMHSLEQPDREYHPEWFHADRREVGQVFALLDLLGWNARCEPRDTEVNLSEHGQVIKEAIHGYLPLLEDQEQDAHANNESSRETTIALRLAACRGFAAVLERLVRELA
jgi:hypothetical protein